MKLFWSSDLYDIVKNMRLESFLFLSDETVLEHVPVIAAGLRFNSGPPHIKDVQKMLLGNFLAYSIRTDLASLFS